MALISIYKIVGLYKNLVIQPLYIAKRMVMSNKINNPFIFILGQSTVLQELPRKRHPFSLLILPIGISVFLSAKRASYIMEYGRNLQNSLCFFIQFL